MVFSATTLLLLAFLAFLLVGSQGDAQQQDEQGGEGLEGVDDGDSDALIFQNGRGELEITGPEGVLINSVDVVRQLANASTAISSLGSRLSASQSLVNSLETAVGSLETRLSAAESNEALLSSLLCPSLLYMPVEAAIVGYRGAVLTANNLVVGIPSASLSFQVWNATSRSFLDTFNDLPEGGDKWFNPVLGLDGKVYGAPFNNPYIFVFDPVALSWSMSVFPITSGLGGRWIGGAAADDGRLFFAPYNADSILIADPSASTIDQAITVENMARKYVDAINVGDGRILFVPFDASRIGVVDTAASSFSTDVFAYSDTSTDKYHGAVLAGNGKAYCIPVKAESVLVIDPATNTTAHIPLPSVGPFMFAGWNGGEFLASLNIIVGTPFDHSSPLVIDVARGTVEVDRIPIGEEPRYGGQALLRDGSLFYIGHTKDHGLLTYTGRFRDSANCLR